MREFAAVDSRSSKPRFKLSKSRSSKEVHRLYLPDVMLIGMWALMCIAIPLWALFDASGWDLEIYRAAVESVHVGRDPYLDSIVKQATYLKRLEHHQVAPGDAPNNYVYPPVTLPLLRVAGEYPGWVLATGYWLLYALGALAVVWAGMQAVEADERRYVRFVAPVALFFPALLENGVILCGNIAYIVYGLALTAAVVGWKAGRWGLLFLVVLAASAFKITFLTLLLIPVFSARKQWSTALLIAFNGIAIFVSQLIASPVLFKHFEQAVELQIVNNRDFGCSPAGIFAGVLFDHGIAYTEAGIVFYLAYALLLFCVLAYFSHLFKGGLIPLKRWIPLLLLGVILINPRIIEYDLAVLSIPLVLIIWRLLPELKTSRAIAASTLAAFVVMNVVAFHNWLWWKEIACLLMITLFVAGTRQLHLSSTWKEPNSFPRDAARQHSQ